MIAKLIENKTSKTVYCYSSKDFKESKLSYVNVEVVVFVRNAHS